MNLLLSALSIFDPIAQIYLLWIITRQLKMIANDSQKREELQKMVKDFGLMFAAAADVPRPGRPKKLDTLA